MHVLLSYPAVKAKEKFLRQAHVIFLTRAQADCNKLAERFRTYCSHTQSVCRSLAKLRSWNTYDEEKLLIGREAELLHMYCQLSDEAVRIRKHLEELQDVDFKGCEGDENPECRCWMGTEDERNLGGNNKMKGILDVRVPDGRISFLDDKGDILEVGKRAEMAVWLVLRTPPEYAGIKFSGDKTMIWPPSFEPRGGVDTKPPSYSG